MFSDFWQSTERLHCTGATLLLLLRATCPFNEEEAASLSKEILFFGIGGGGGGIIRDPKIRVRRRQRKRR